jgi:hypothetical protein
VDTPTYNAEGLQTWKPQPGEYYRLGLKQRESYGGVVAALKDVKEAWSCGIPKAYPHNFAGIIAAIEDLANCIDAGNNIDVGPSPPGWEINIDIDGNIEGNWIIVPPDGNLWFDTRQGRLFVSIDGAYWQTNGGDGLAYVNESVPPQQPVIGSTWYDTYNKIMYVWTDEGVWEAVRGAEDVAQTTATLPLAFKGRLTAGGGGGARILPDDFPTSDEFPSVLPPLNLAEQNVQADYNEWLLWALLRVGEATEYNTINFGPEPPPEDQLQPGSMWYDTNALELSVWYSDGDSSQWVPTSVSYQYDEALARIENQIATESAERTQEIQQAKNDINRDISTVRADLENLDLQIRDEIIRAVDAIDIPEINLSPYSTVQSLATTRAELETQINTFKSNLEAELLLVKDNLSAVDTDLINTINSKVTPEQLAAVSAAIPDISQLTTETTVDSKISNITTNFLPRTGGRFTGGITMDKSDLTQAGFDFSTNPYSGYNALNFRSVAPTEEYVNFGTTNEFWEYAWKFNSEEDFCWIHDDNNKVFSITKEGPACSTLILGDFGDNTQDGRAVHNKIDVRDRLSKYQTAFEEMRQSISLADDFDELKLALLTALASV